MSNFGGFIAVHLGAGYHSLDTRKAILLSAKSACALRHAGDAVSLCADGIRILEDSPLTNAGIGSNLTLEETVECDASIMCGSTLCFGAVGGMSGVRNPIHVAEKLLRTQKETSSMLISPLILVGEGARKYALSMGLESASEREMVTKRSLEEFRGALKRMNSSQEVLEHNYTALDTVG